jgi:hypothetical protein
MLLSIRLVPIRLAGSPLNPGLMIPPRTPIGGSKVLQSGQRTGITLRTALIRIIGSYSKLPSYCGWPTGSASGSDWRPRRRSSLSASTCAATGIRAFGG